MAVSRFSVLPRILPSFRALCRGALVQRNCLQTRCMSTSHEEMLMNDFKVYKGFLKDKNIALSKRLNNPNRFQKIANREDRSDIPIAAEIAQCEGKHLIHHRGCSVMKTANDMIIFNELLWKVRPATIIELGACSGGSALWMADTLRMMEIDTTIYSMDIDLSNIVVGKLKPDNLHFLQGDSFEVDKSFTPEMLKSLPHPWVIIEDTHTNIYGIMKYFRSFMNADDYFIVEDLSPFIPCHVGQGGVYDREYKPAGPEVLVDLKKFMNEYADEFAVDSFYTDFFGYNGTWNMHGYIKKM